MTEIFTDRFGRTISSGLGGSPYGYDDEETFDGNSSVNGAYGIVDAEAFYIATPPVPAGSEGTAQYDFWVPADINDDWTYYSYGFGKTNAPSLGAGWFWFHRLEIFVQATNTWRIWSSSSCFFDFTPEPSTWYTAKVGWNYNTIVAQSIVRVKVWKKNTTEPEFFQDSGIGSSGNNPSFDPIHLNIGGGQTAAARFDNVRIFDEFFSEITPEPILLVQEPKVAATVLIKYDGDDITDYCSIAESSFTSRAGGQPGQATITFRDTRQRFTFIPGKTLELFINGDRAWDGYAMSLGYNYWFETHTADCEPCPHVTPRKLILYGADRNILFAKRVLYNKVSPENNDFVYWPANTPDDEVIIDSITDYVDDVDGVDYTTKVENVGSPDPYVEFHVPGPTNTLLLLMMEIAQSTGAVFYIDPDRFLIYTDVNNPDAPWTLTDLPVDEGMVGYRDFELLSEGSRMVNDAMIWGAGQGSPDIAFARVEDDDAINAHGRWQNVGGFRTNLWQSSSVQRVANSIVYGSPANKRGHKDPVISVRCTTFHHGFRVAQKAEVICGLFDFTDVIPIREMTISFVGPGEVKYDLLLSHDIDEPWTTSEFWWPEWERTGPPDPPGPRTVCSGPTTEDSEVPALVFDEDKVAPPWRRAQRNSIDDFFSIQHGHNHWTFYKSLNGDLYTTGNEIKMTYRHQWEDDYFYNNGGGGLENPGPLVNIWDTERRGILSPENAQWPGSGVYLNIEGTVTFTGEEADRDVEGRLFPFPGVDRVGEIPLVLPHLITFGLMTPRGEEGGMAPGGLDIDPSPEPNVISGLPLWEAFMMPGESLPLSVRTRMTEGTRKYLGIGIKEFRLTKPWAEMTASLTAYSIQWTDARPNIALFPIPIDGDGVECVEIGYGQTSVHHEAVLLYGNVYRVPMAYTPGTTRVYVDGLHWTDYDETSPLLGQITFGEAVTGTVTVQYITSSANLTLPSAPGYFILPVNGPITGSFGAQTDGWPPAYWNGVYYDHFHNGVDFGVGVGTAVYAAQSGLVRHESQFAGGTMIHIFHDNGLRSTYAHLSSRVVNDGETVAQGQLIGYSGDTGDVTGPHLHWGVTFKGSPQDPLGFV